MDKQFGDGWVREMLGAQLRWVVSLLDAHVDPAAKGGLHSSVGALARYTGWSTHDMGLDTAAQRYCEVALHCAEQADDWSLRGKSRRLWSVIRDGGPSWSSPAPAALCMVRGA